MLTSMQILNDMYQVDLRVLLWCRKSVFYPQWMNLVRLCSRSGDGYMQVFLPLGLYALLPDGGAVFLYSVVVAFSIERAL